MSKKLISMLLLALTLGTVLAGCSGGEKAAEGDAKPAEGTTDKPAEGEKAEETK